jgi:hypothetical protein
MTDTTRPGVANDHAVETGIPGFSPIPEFDPVQAAQYMQVLHGNAVGTGDVVMTLLGDGGRATQIPFDCVADDDLNFIGFISENVHLNLNIYVTPSRFAKDRKAGRTTRREQDVISIAGTWTDVDIKLMTRNEMIQVLSQLPLYTMLVDSGSGGLHPYWLYADPERDRKRAKELNRRWIAHCSNVATQVLGREITFDAVQDLSRVLRLPGTVRFKDAQSPTPVRLLYHEGPRYGIADLEAIAPPLAARHVRIAVDGAVQALASDAPKLVAYVKAAVRGEAEQLAAIAQNGGRNNGLNKSAFSLGTLAAHGIPDKETVYTALFEACERNGVNAEDGADKFDSTFNRAWEAGLAQPRALPAELTQNPEDDPDGGVRLASEFTLRPVSWLWLGRIPRRKITMHDGDPGRGKSLTYTSITAAITTGRALPGEVLPGRPPVGVVIICAEDDWEDTIMPRLLAAGADLDKVATLTLQRDAKGEVIPLTIPKDLYRIRRAIDRVGAELVVIDPIMAYLGEETNSHNDASVRRALAPLKEFAEETGVAVLLVRHLNKNGELKAEYRGGGSIGFTAQARSALISEFHPTEEGVLVLAQLKNNLAVLAPSLTYKIEPVHVERDGVQVRVPVIRWGQTVDMTAEELLRGSDGRKESPEKTECWARMSELFAEKDRWPAAEMTKLLNEFSTSTIKRVRRDHGVRSVRVQGDQGKTTGWDWLAPDSSGPESEEMTKRIEAWSAGLDEDQ